MMMVSLMMMILLFSFRLSLAFKVMGGTLGVFGMHFPLDYLPDRRESP
jgi:hypothetical protein